MWELGGEAMNLEEDMELVFKSLDGDVDKLADYIYETYCTYGSHDAAYSKKAIAALINTVQHHATTKSPFLGLREI